VLSLPDAATYLRLSEQKLLGLVRVQNLPARKMGAEWRFLKTAIDEWLSQPVPDRNREGIWAFAGAWKDDQHAAEMLKEIYRKRGRPMTEK
jgi:excisionase family DNA binding protein